MANLIPQNKSMLTRMWNRGRMFFNFGSNVKRDGFGTITGGDSLFPPDQPKTTPLQHGNASAFYSAIVQIARDVLITSDVAYRTNRQMAVQMMRDVMIRQPLERRMKAVAQQEWKIEALPDASLDVKQVAGRLDQMIRQSERISDLFLALSWGIWRGLGAAEINWVSIANEYWPASYRVVNGDKIMFDEWGKPRVRTREFQYGGRELSQDELTRIILHQYLPDDGDFYEGQEADYQYRGRGIRDVIWPYWFLRNQAMKIWVQFLETRATGLLVGKYPANNSEAQSAIETALQNLLNGTKVQLPVFDADQAQYGIEAIPLGNTGEASQVFTDFIEGWAGRYIRLYIQGEDQANQEHGDGLGSGRAKALQNNFQLLTDYDSTIMEQTLTRQLAHRCMDYNFPRVPKSQIRFRFLRYDVDYEQMQRQFSIAQSLGMSVPENWARSQLGVPTPDADEPVLHTAMQPVSPGMGPEPEAGGAFFDEPQG